MVRLAEYAREEINRIGGYYAYSRELCDGDSIYDFDVTKLSVNTLDIGLAGIEVYDLLRDDYNIQIEFGDLGNILAYLSIGDRPRDIERLVGALSEIRRRFRREKTDLFTQEYIDPKVVASPRSLLRGKKNPCPWRRPAAGCAASLSCAILRGFPFWLPGRRSQIPSWIISATPGKRAAP